MAVLSYWFTAMFRRRRRNPDRIERVAYRPDSRKLKMGWNGTGDDGDEEQPFPTFRASALDQPTALGEGNRLMKARLALRDVFTPAQPVTDRNRFAGRLGVLALPAFWWALALLPLNGALNVIVSFYLAFRMALRAHNINGVERSRIYAAIRQRLRSKPSSFFLP